MVNRCLRFSVVSREKSKVSSILKKKGFSVVTEKPDFVVAFGGDGTILASERLFPGVPKLGVRNSTRCNTCAVRFQGTHQKELMCWSCLDYGLQSVLAGKFDVVSHPKIEAQTKEIIFTALNEIQIHNADPRTTIRFNVMAGGKPLAEDVLGDGMLLATPFGSTGYFQTLARQTFQSGFGLAFNNPIVFKKPVFFKKLPVFDVCVTRGPAVLLADNDSRKVILSAGQKVVFRKSRQDARFVVLR